MPVSDYEKVIYWPPGLDALGGLKVYARGRILEGRREGAWVFFHKNGQKLMEGAYRAGKQEGPWIKWWENGQIQSQGGFLEGKMHGTWIDRFDNGDMAQQSGWDRGRRSGETVVFERGTGRVRKSAKYDPEKEQDLGYRLMTDRDAAFAVKCAQKARIRRSWEVLVGKRIAATLEPWHIASWIIFMVLVYGALARWSDIGVMAIPASVIGASLASVVVVLASLYFDHHTRPDIGL